jgi:hypothetical protein
MDAFDALDRMHGTLWRSVLQLCLLKQQQQLQIVPRARRQRAGQGRGKKFVAAGLQTRPFAVPHKNEDRPHLQVHQITFLLYY